MLSYFHHAGHRFPVEVWLVPSSWEGFPVQNVDSLPIPSGNIESLVSLRSHEAHKSSNGTAVAIFVLSQYI